MAHTLAEAVSRFGQSVQAKLNDPAATGEPEDQLRNPFENLLAALNALIGPAAKGVTAVGEVRLADLMTRPDFALRQAPSGGPAPSAASTSPACPSKADGKVDSRP